MYAWVCWKLKEQQKFSKTSATIGIRSLGGNTGERNRTGTEESTFYLAYMSMCAHSNMIATSLMWLLTLKSLKIRNPLHGSHSNHTAHSHQTHRVSATMQNGYR